MKTFKKVLIRSLLFGACLAATTLVHAQIDYTGSIDPHLLVTDWSRASVGTEISGTFGEDYTTRNWQIQDVTTLADALTNDRYFGFTLQTEAGYSLDLSTATVNFEIASFGRSTGNVIVQGHAPANFAIFAYVGDNTINLTPDIDGSPRFAFTWNGITNGLETIVGSILLSDVLGDAQLATLSSITDPVEFRIYAWNTGGQNSSGPFTLSDFSLAGGTVSAVPEPATYAALLALAVLAGTALHRGRRTAQK
ncbi:hypothetical protein OPIT5_20145 [Opitutaceae bacterium TAV5]|nr:hypothetical protein OPIT5_20145 [Opitutaceae bacterium TAV5]